jgi:glycosyltransferase involved in cell wall biosynthesis
MGLLYILAAVSFLILFLINVIWLASNLYLTINGQIELFLHGKNPVENIYYSVYLKWIIFADVFWLLGALIFMLRRKQYKTDPTLHHLSYNLLLNPIICIIIPAYNEAGAIKKVVKEHLNQEFVKYVIVIDNKSTDDTADIAEKAGAIVIRKKKNLGFAHSYILGLKEALKTDSNIIATTEADDNFNAYDIKKMLPYLDNCDMVIGTRQNQILTEKGNQNSLLHVWGNFFLAKLIQIKYFSLLHTGIVNLTDVGCIFRLIRRDALEKIVNDLAFPDSDKTIAGIAVTIHLTMLGIEKDLKIIEVPITFKKRIGISKIGTNKKFHAIKVGLIFLWFILRY